MQLKEINTEMTRKNPHSELTFMEKTSIYLRHQHQKRLAEQSGKPQKKTKLREIDRNKLQAYFKILAQFLTTTKTQHKRDLPEIIKPEKANRYED